MDTDVCHAVHISMAKQSKAKLFQMIELDPKFVIDYLGLLVSDSDNSTIQKNLRQTQIACMN